MSAYSREAKSVRQLQLDNIKTPQRENYQSEEEYRNALIQTYNQLRNTEYNHIVLNECTKVYNIARDAKRNGEHENTQIWRGFRNYEVGDSAVVRTPELGRTIYGSKQDITENYASCAITAISLCSQCSAKMGYDGAQNLFQAQKRNNPAAPFTHINIANGTFLGCANNSASARDFCATESIAPYCTKHEEKITLQELMKSGEIKPGDMISIKTKNGATNTTSGYHAITIADITYDKTGNITHYTVHENNPRGLKTYNINDTNNYANYKVNTVSHVNNMINDRVANETNNKSIEELEQMVTSTKERTSNTINSLYEAETYMYNKQYAQTPQNDNDKVTTALLTSSEVKLELPEIEDDFNPNIGIAPIDIPTIQPEEIIQTNEVPTTENTEETITPKTFETQIIKPEIKDTPLELPKEIPVINISELQNKFNQRVDAKLTTSEPSISREDVATTMKKDATNIKPLLQQLKNKEIPNTNSNQTTNDNQQILELKIDSRGKTQLTTHKTMTVQQLQSMLQNRR